jgi:hypothetical protein
MLICILCSLCAIMNHLFNFHSLQYLSLVLDKLSFSLLQEKRRDTWCLGNLSREVLREVNSFFFLLPSDVSFVKL